MKYAFVLGAALLAAASATLAQSPPDRQAATEKEYRGTLGRLGIQQIRPGADGPRPRGPRGSQL